MLIAPNASMERELTALKFLDGLGAQLRGARDPKQALRLALRGARIL